MSQIESLLNFKWEKYVGRRQPPLRGDLALRGGFKWYSENGFQDDYSKLFIFFSTMVDQDIISDHYVNQDLKKSIVNEFKSRIKNNHEFLGPILDDFWQKTQQLDKFSKSLHTIKNFKDVDFIKLFEDFCLVWQDFGPNLFVLLLATEACEEIIYDDFKNDPDVKTKLMKQVAAGVESEFFKKEIKKAESIENYFPSQYDYCLKLLKEILRRRDQRKMIYESSWYEYSKEFFKELENRTGLGNKVYFLGKDQIASLLRGKALEFVIEFPSLVYADKRQVFVEYGKKVAGLKGKILAMSINVADELTGNIANPGRAVGKVRLIEPHVKNQKFKTGEVLVTKMTTPDLMPFIRKSSAIITDEGGVTSHAAIVSRELNKPCIIGTKIATQVLKNGDLVEVDANKGIVRKLDK